jgi:hypothetical protein
LDESIFSRLIRMGNETALEVLEDIAVAAPTSAREEPPDEESRLLSPGRETRGDGL